MTARKTGESWDEFWAEVSGGPTEVIRGVVVPVPTDVPLILEQRLKELQDEESEEALQEMLSLLFGPTVLDQWIENGMGARELETALAWGFAHAGGKDVSFREAYEMVLEAEAAGGKAPVPNRAQRRAAQKPPSGSTGGRSKRTSAGSTGSTRTRSRA